MSGIDASKFNAIGDIKYRDYDGEIKSINPQKALSFSSENIPFETQAITYYTVGQIMEQVNLQLESAKLNLNRRYSLLYLNLTVDPEMVKANKGRKPTEGMLNAKISLDKEYQEDEQVISQLQMKYNVLKNLFKAFEQRKDLMQSVSAQKRAQGNIKPNTALDTSLDNF